MRILIATHKSWNVSRAEHIKESEPSHDVRIITRKEELNEELVNDFKPDFIFFPHWSYIIPASIYENYSCVVFHMTDLPYGRGGSPLQNLIVRGHKQTKVSAIKVVKELDAGPVYLKEDMSLEGSAHEIYDRASDIVFEKMIPKILKGDYSLTEQTGETVTFKRRCKEDGEILTGMDPEKIYDYIRMLDAEGYPPAFLRFGDYVLEFSDAEFDGKNIEAKVTIRKED